ncbi:hypothetical protein JF66_18210, partial [Cryobacterium sp. MLB-32]
ASDHAKIGQPGQGDYESENQSESHCSEGEDDHYRHGAQQLWKDFEDIVNEIHGDDSLDKRGGRPLCTARVEI